MKEVNLEVKEGELFSEFSNSKNGSCVYGFKLDSLQTPMLEVRIYSKLYNAIVSELGANEDLRIGKSIPLIMLDDMICGVYADREIVINDYYNGRFDGMELYLRNNYGISNQELLGLVKEEMNTKKLKEMC